SRRAYPTPCPTRRSSDRTLATVLQRTAAAPRPWLQAPGHRSPELVGTRYHPPRTHCLIGYKFHTQVTAALPARHPEGPGARPYRSEEHTSELQSREKTVC